ncbi:MAG: glycosyltransferase, partial [Pseudomonadota bacterium]
MNATDSKPVKRRENGASGSGKRASDKGPPPPQVPRLAIITPVYNDWDAFRQLASAIDTNVAPLDVSATIIAVDDGSVEPCPDLGPVLTDCESVKAIEVVHLVRNMGHQKAIAIGLSHVHDDVPYDGVLVLDADGE